MATSFAETAERDVYKRQRFNSTRDHISNLGLKVFECEFIKTVKLDEFTVVGYFEGKSSSHGNGYPKIGESLVKHVEVPYSKTRLNNLGKIDEVNFRLKRSRCV